MGPNGVGAPSEGGGRVPTSAPPPSEPSDNASALLARLKESEAAVAMHKAEAEAIQRRLEMARGGHELTPEQLGEMRDLSDQREAVTKARLERRHDFLERNPNLKSRLDELGRVHEEAMLQGIRDETPEYYDLLEHRFGNVKRPPSAKTKTRAPPEEDDPLRGLRGAPVSREPINYATGRSYEPPPKLSEQELEAANYSGVDPDTYLREKLRMADFKKRGLIQDTGGR
jgi:hypothetical protein